MTKVSTSEMEARIRIGKRLREVREDRGYTLAKAGLEMGMDESTVSRIENGKHNFGIDVVVKYCHLFKCTLDIS
jgi:transcriptional regulator with XRE-family HTH domain